MTQSEKETYEIMANALFDAYNAAIGNVLPKVPVVLGRGNMSRCAGYIRAYRSKRDGYGEVQIGNMNSYKYARIVISPVFIEQGYGEDVLIETLKHEMAHLGQLSTRGVMDHGYSFKKWCITLGCNPATHHSIGAENPDGQHVYFCPDCGEISRYDRRVENADGGCCQDCSIKNGHQVNKRYLGHASELRMINLVGLNESLHRFSLAANKGV